MKKGIVEAHPLKAVFVLEGDSDFRFGGGRTGVIASGGRDGLPSTISRLLVQKLPLPKSRERAFFEVFSRGAPNRYDEYTLVRAVKSSRRCAPSFSRPNNVLNLLNVSASVDLFYDANSFGTHCSIQRVIQPVVVQRTLAGLWDLTNLITDSYQNEASGDPREDPFEDPREDFCGNLYGVWDIFPGLNILITEVDEISIWEAIRERYPFIN